MFFDKTWQYYIKLITEIDLTLDYIRLKLGRVLKT